MVKDTGSISDTRTRTGQDPRLSLPAAISVSRPAFIAIGIFSFFINLLMLTGPLFMLQIYDRVLASRSLPTLTVLFFLVAALFLVMGLLELIRSRVLGRIGTHVAQRIHERLFDAVMQTGLRGGGNKQAGAPLRELDVIQQYLSGPGFTLWFDAPWVPIYMWVIFLFHPWLGWLAVAAALFLFFIALLNDWRARAPLRDAGIVAVEAHQLAETGQRNGEALAAMGMLGALRSRWSEKHLAALYSQTQARDRAGTLSALSKSFRLFVQSAMLAAGAVFVINGEITPGVMIAASIILGRALQPIEQAIVHWRGYVRYRQAKKVISDLLDNSPRPTEKTSLPKPKGLLEVRELHVAAPGSKDLILRNINFSLNAGKILGVIGDSAAGKTTLARVLTGVWKAVGGEIRIDGASHDQWHPDELGRYIGYLPQDVELFDGTIAENISRLEKNPDSDAIILAAEQAGVHDMIKHLGGYETDIGAKGSNLSAGQRQRIALARALYGAPVLIVLDEPNSNLDEKSERALFIAINGMRERGQTVVIVTHRHNILALADDLLVLHASRQVAWGGREKVLSELKKRHHDAVGKEPQRQETGEVPQAKKPDGKSGFEITDGGGFKWNRKNSSSPSPQTKGNESSGNKDK